jgi:hypothetical protein
LRGFLGRMLCDFSSRRYSRLACSRADIVPYVKNASAIYGIATLYQGMTQKSSGERKTPPKNSNSGGREWKRFVTSGRSPDSCARQVTNTQEVLLLRDRYLL